MEKLELNRVNLKYLRVWKNMLKLLELLNELDILDQYYIGANRRYRYTSI